MTYNKQYYDNNKHIFKKASQKCYYGNHEERKKDLRKRSKKRTYFKRKQRMKTYMILYKNILKTEDYVKRLHYFRKSIGKTQQEIAKHLKISQPAYLKYEKGKITKRHLLKTILTLEYIFSNKII